MWNHTSAGFETRSLAYLLTTATDRPNVFCMQHFSLSSNFNPLPCSPKPERLNINSLSQVENAKRAKLPKSSPAEQGKRLIQSPVEATQPPVIRT